MLTNWKTTLTGIAGFLVGGAIYLKWITPENGGAVMGLIVAVLGTFAKDGDVTGGTREQ